MALRLLLWPNLPNFSKGRRTSNGTSPQVIIRCSRSTQVSELDQETKRHRGSANYQPTLWTFDYLQSLVPQDGHRPSEEQMQRRAQMLMEKVRSAVNDENAEPLTTVALVDDIQRLGIGYLFEEDIVKALRRSLSMDVRNESKEKTLHGTALSFRVLRQHGFHVSQDVFKTFMNEDGKFSTTLLSDIQGMLSLYEASNLAFEEEDILREAKVFAIQGLKNTKESTAKTLEGKMNLGLDRPPIHHRMPLQEACSFIEASSLHNEANHLLVELAVMNFNMVQSTLKRDLQEMSRWWNDVGLAKKLNFTRGRLMECFFWAVGLVYEPQFRTCRKGLTKVAALITVLDDVYDVYGTLDELELFTNAVERWDVNVVENLPDYMKLCFLALYNTVHEIAYDALKEKGVVIIPYLTKAWSDMLKAFLQEAKWSNNNITPTFDEYLKNGWMSSSGPLFLTHAYFSTSSSIKDEELQLIEMYHDLLQLPSMIFRLYNDFATSSAELARGETANSILCYMQGKGVSEEVAREHIRELIDTSWKKTNKYQVNDSIFEKSFVQIAFNLARIAHCTYQHGDSHGAPDDRSRNRIHSLLIEPISLGPTLEKKWNIWTNN